MHCKSSDCRGVAAIEFALVMLLLLVILSGLFVYGLLLQTQQSVVRATGDGARLLQEIATPVKLQNPSQRALVVQDVRSFVRRGIREAGLANSATTSVDVVWGTGQATLNVTYPNPVGDGLWSGLKVLDRLDAQAVVALQASP